MPVWVQMVTALGGILGLGVAGGSPFFIRAQLRKFRADSGQSDATAAETIQRSAQALFLPAVERAIQLETDLATARKQVFDLTVALAGAQQEVSALRGQVAKMSTELQEARVELDQYRGGGTSGIST